MNSRLFLTANGRLLGLAAMLLGSSVLVPYAHADIIEVEGATGCPGSVGGGLCTGSSAPFDLSTLLVDLSSPGSIGSGTQKYVVTDDINAPSFSFELFSTGEHHTGVADNGACQINGGAKSIFDACTIVDDIGQTTSLGGAQINDLTFPITVTFSGSSLFGKTFDLGFASMQGSSHTAIPEPAYLPLLGAAFLAVFARRGLLTFRSSSQRSAQ